MQASTYGRRRRRMLGARATIFGNTPQVSIDEREQRESGIERPRLQVSLGCREGTVRSPGRVRRERGGAEQERRRRRQSAACLSATGTPLELGGDLLVRSGGGRGAMPGPAVSVELRISGVGE